MKSILNYELPECPEDKLTLFCLIGIIVLFLLYLAGLYYIVTRFLSSPSAITFQDGVISYATLKLHRQVTSRLKLKK